MIIYAIAPPPSLSLSSSRAGRGGSFKGDMCDMTMASWHATSRREGQQSMRDLIKLWKCSSQFATCKIANSRRWLIEENCENSAVGQAHTHTRSTYTEHTRGQWHLRGIDACRQADSRDSWDSKFISHTLDYFEASPNKFRRCTTHLPRLETQSLPPLPAPPATSDVCGGGGGGSGGVVNTQPDAGRPKAKNCIANRKDTQKN